MKVGIVLIKERKIYYRRRIFYIEFWFSLKVYEMLNIWKRFLVIKNY